MDYDVRHNLNAIIDSLPEGVKLVAVSKYHPNEYMKKHTLKVSEYSERVMSRNCLKSKRHCQRTYNGILSVICRQTR